MVQEELVQFEELFTISNIFYKAIGVTPLLKDAQPTVLRSTFYWISFFNLWIAYVGEFIFMGTSFGKFGSFLQMTALAPCMCFVTLAVNEMILIKRQRTRLVEVIATLEKQFPKTIEEQCAEKVMEKKRQFDRYLFGFSGAFLILIMTFNFIPFIVTLVQYLVHGVWKKELPYFVWYPFDEFDNRYFAAIYLHQTYAGFTTVFAILAEDFLIGTCVFTVCIQFERISKTIKSFKPGKASENRVFLRQLIIDHNFILENADEFADIISGTLFINYICSSLIICFVGFQVVVGEDLTIIFKFVLFLFCSLMQTIMLSYFGNELIETVRDTILMTSE